MTLKRVNENSTIHATARSHGDQSTESKPSLMRGCLDLIQRVFVGPVLIAVGLLLYTGLIFLVRMPKTDIYQSIVVMLCAEAYGIIAGLFVLLGLQYTLGPRSWIDRMIGRSLTSIAAVSAVITVVVLVVLSVFVR